MLLGLGLATWMVFCTYDGVNQCCRIWLHAGTVAGPSELDLRDYRTIDDKNVAAITATVSLRRHIRYGVNIGRSPNAANKSAIASKSECPANTEGFKKSWSYLRSLISIANFQCW
jgi:hypothetical protein